MELAVSADVVIGAGDFATMHLGLEQTINALAPIDKPAVLVPGNHETETALWRACADWPSAVILHGEGTEIGGVQFYGLGAGRSADPLPMELRPERRGRGREVGGLSAGRRARGPFAAARLHGRGPWPPPRQRGDPADDRAQATSSRGLRTYPRVLGSRGDDRRDADRQPRPGRAVLRGLSGARSLAARAA